MHNDDRKYLFVFAVGDRSESMQSRTVEVITADTKRCAWRDIARKTAKGKSILLIARTAVLRRPESPGRHFPYHAEHPFTRR